MSEFGVHLIQLVEYTPAEQLTFEQVEQRIIDELKPIRATSNSRPLARVTPARSAEVLRADLSFIPERPGEYKLGVEVEALDGEIKTNNNRLETIITVRKGGVRVAYFDQPLRAEQKFIRRINVADKIQLDFQPVRPPPLPAAWPGWRLPTLLRPQQQNGTGKA